MSYALAVAVVAITLFSNDSTAKQSSSGWKKEISNAIADELENSGTPSIQVAIGKHDRVIFESTYGMADLENNVIATDKSKYRIGSVSKWFTAVATKVLIADGTLDPEAPIQTYCPQFPKKKWPISSNNLLTHRSGIRHYIDYNDQLEKAESSQQREQITSNRDRELLSSYTRYEDVIAPLESFKNDPLLFEPNTGWTYSSFGYRVLACVLEGAANMNYSELMDELIFKKANMTSTVKDDAWQIIPHRTTGYKLNRNKSLRKADLRDTSENLAAGGYLSTASDLALFALALNSGKLSARRNGLKNQSWSVDNNDSVGQQSSWRNAIPSQQYYAAGEMYFPDKSRLWVGHTGRIAGGSAIVVLQPESGLSIAVTTNAKGWNGYISLIDELKLILEASSDLLE